MTEQERKRIEDTLSALEDELAFTCPSEQLKDEPKLKCCCEEFCLTAGGSECWKRYILGEID